MSLLPYVIIASINITCSIITFSSTNSSYSEYLWIGVASSSTGITFEGCNPTGTQWHMI